MVIVVIVIVAVLVVAIALAVLYNRLVRLRNRTENAWSQVDVQLRRRYDLIPNLVETVKGYAAHEQSTFEDVTKARTAAQQAQGVEQQASAENALTAAIGRLFAVAEAYPQLRATENFQQLQAQLADTEQKIAVSRAGLQRHRAHLRQRDPDGAEQPDRRDVRLPVAARTSRSTSRQPARRRRSPSEPAARGRCSPSRRPGRRSGRRGQVVHAPVGRRRRHGAARRRAPRRREHHLPVQRAVHRRVPRGAGAERPSR